MPTREQSRPVPLFLQGAERIGNGGYGAVYRIPTSTWNTIRPHDSTTTMAPTVALKEIRRDDKTKEAAIHAAASTCSTDVPAFYGSFIHDNVRYLAMEDLRGYHALDHLDLKTYTRLVVALRRLHRCGIVHGDLHHGNILVRGNSLKIIDFGLSRHGHNGNQDNGEVLRGMVTSRVRNIIENKNLKKLKAWSAVKHAPRGDHMLSNAIRANWPKGVEYVINSGAYKNKYLKSYMHHHVTPDVARVLKKRGLL